MNNKLTPELFKQIAEGLFDYFTFDIDKDNEHVIKLLCMWANEDPEFENIDGGKYCLGKGLMLLGNPGSGKTKLLEVLQGYFNMYNHPMRFSKTCIWREARNYKISGDVVFDRLKQGHWLYDELRRDVNEEVVSFYKNTVDMGRDIIYTAYEGYTGPYQWMSHFTTNMSNSELQKTFDDGIDVGGGVKKSRAYSRLKEMCNFITCISSVDRRETAKPKRKSTKEYHELDENQIKERDEKTRLDAIELMVEDFTTWSDKEEIKSIRLPLMYYDILIEMNLLDLSNTMKTALMDKANRNIQEHLSLTITGRGYDIKSLMTEINGNPQHNRIITLAKTYAIADYFTIIKAEETDLKKLLLNHLNNKS